MADSYHDKIQEIARAIEASRAERYNEHTPITWNPIEKLFLDAALYKIERLVLGEKRFDKALDDMLDVYNFMALAFRETSKRFTSVTVENGQVVAK